MKNTKTKILDSLNLFQNENQVRSATALMLLILIVIGFWLRVRHLGDLALIVDEGIQALAVKGILKDGVPKVDSGHIYTRAISFLYIQAAAARLFELNPFWLRLPSVIFGVAIIIPSYILGRTLFGRSVGLLTASILTFSVWEIELSRYARFYTAFQFMYLISIFCFYKGFMRDERNYKIWFLLAAFATFSTHALSQVLLSLFLIPLLSTSFTVSRKLLFGLWGVGLVGLLIFYKKLIGLMKTFEDPLLATLETAGDAINVVPSVLDKIQWIFGLPPIHLPDLFFFPQTMQHYPLPFAGLVMIAGISTVYFIYCFFQQDSFWKIMFPISIIWAAFFYQFAIVMVLLSLHLILFIREYRNLWKPQLIVIYSVTVIYLIIWFIFIYGRPQVSLKHAVVEIFGFPNFAKYFLYWLIKGWPAMTAVFAFGCIMLLTTYFSNRRRILPIFVLGAIFIPAFMASFFKSYHESRYIFHLYPLIVIVFSMVSVEAISYILVNFPFRRKSRHVLVTPILIVAILFISQDANPLHAWSIGNRTYQSTRDRFRSVISWKPYAGFHQDHQNPSISVKDHLSPEDKIVVLGPIHMIGLYHFYTGNVDYAVAPTRTPTYYSLSKKGKLINYVTGSEILGGLPGFKTFLEKSSKGVWLIGDYLLLIDENEFYSRTLKEYLRPLVKNPDFIGRDGQTFAVKIR